MVQKPSIAAWKPAALIAALNIGIVLAAEVFRRTVAPGWRKGPLIDPASPYSPENAAILFAVAACVFVDVYLLGLARLPRRRWASSAMLVVSAVASEAAIRGWLAVDMVTYFRPHPTLQWVVRPNLHDFDNIQGGGHITTNADGMREVTVPREKRPGEYRVLVLGDSSNFGHGVEGNEVWTSVLQALDPKITVLNGACPGWTTTEGVEFLRTIGLAYHPDLVIAGFNNDPGPEYMTDTARMPRGAVRAANELLFRSETYLLSREVALSLLRRAAGSYTERAAGDQPIYGKLPDSEQAGLVPRVPLEEFKANLKQLEAMSPAFAWINLPINRSQPEMVERYVNPAWRDAAAQVAKEAGFPLVDVDARWVREGAGVDWFMPGHVFHPSAKGHAELAKQVREEFFPGDAPQGGVLEGLCEASTVVPWKDGYLVGDNETSDRLFAFGPDLSPRAPVPIADPVEDIESIARDGDRLWIMGSQSANKKGKRHPGRERVAILGEPSHGLDLSACAACEAARGLAPNDGGLNIEGTVILDGHPWVGLRGPVVDGKALLLELTADGTKADRVLSLDLDGFAIRELSPWRGGVLLIAGPVADDPVPHRLYWLPTAESIPLLLPVDLPPSTEGIAVADSGDAVIVTDGSGKAGTTCEMPSTWKRIHLAEPAAP